MSFVQFWFTDVLGIQKIFSITPSELEEGMAEGMGFDGSSIEGFCRIEESDMIAKPDPTTFQILPYRPQDRPVARMFCDILNPEGSPYEGDPRYVLKRIVSKVKKLGYTYNVGPELEYFYFASDKAADCLDRGGISTAFPSTGRRISADRRYLRFRIWGYGWNIRTMRSLRASMRSTSAMPRP